MMVTGRIKITSSSPGTSSNVSVAITGDTAANIGKIGDAFGFANPTNTNTATAATITGGAAVDLVQILQLLILMVLVTVITQVNGTRLQNK